ncbi:unnamed protein product [Meloidogyne enterolobii]|uniref:Uncharacterized protein n=1 Tax=Meloidogyne enterolobii TaxID=390850 RepID=A0ACB0YR26_MELEN
MPPINNPRHTTASIPDKMKKKEKWYFVGNALLGWGVFLLLVLDSTECELIFMCKNVLE